MTNGSQANEAATNQENSEADFLTIAKVGEIPANEGRTYPVEGRLVAVFFVDGQYHAIDDACPHMGASLASGWVENGCVMCPWHAWRFRVSDGAWMDAPNSKVRAKSHELRIVGDDIQIRRPV